jgi:hypothetical protein
LGWRAYFVGTDGADNPGEVVAGGVAGFSVGAFASGVLFGGGRNGPLTPQPASIATAVAIAAARTANCSEN